MCARDFATVVDKHSILRRKVAHAWLDFVATNQVSDGPEVRVGASGTAEERGDANERLLWLLLQICYSCGPLGYIAVHGSWYAIYSTSTGRLLHTQAKK